MMLWKMCFLSNMAIFDIYIVRFQGCTQMSQVNNSNFWTSGNVGKYTIHGTGIFTYMKTIKINHSCIDKCPMDAIG